MWMVSEKDVCIIISILSHLHIKPVLCCKLRVWGAWVRDYNTLPQFISNVKTACTNVLAFALTLQTNRCHMIIIIGFPKLAHHYSQIQESHLQICFTSESSSSKRWAIFLPKAKWLESTCITTQAAIGVWPCRRVCEEFSFHLHYSFLP